MLIFMSTVFAVLLFAYRTTFPELERALVAKTRSCLRSMRVDGDIAIASERKAALQHVVASCNIGSTADPDLRYVAVVSRDGRVLARRGELPPNPPWAKTPIKFGVDHESEIVRGGLAVEMEGLRLGSLWVAYSNERIRDVKRGALVFATLITIVLFVSSIAGIFFALYWVRPLRELIDFVHGVAEGELEEKLTVKASDELAVLARDLETMRQRLRESRDALASQHRLAGRAEVATSVLHNVGNVLNSVTVAASVAINTVRASSLNKLERSTALLQEHASDLATFLSEDAKGKQLLRFLTLLVGQLEQERQTVLSELAVLSKHVEHVVAIISAQQEHARSVGIIEHVDPIEVLETALEIHASSFKGHGIILTRDFGDVGLVYADRHQLLEILVNLVKNARDSLVESVANPREIVVRVFNREGTRKLVIEVTDNGLGVATEHTGRIFNQGFTTKASGLGLGLHTSALAAAKMGGNLKCRSDGVNCGATFELELPEHVTNSTKERDESCRR